MSGVVLRPMHREDLEAVLAIEREGFPTPWSRGLFEDEVLRAPSRLWLVLDSPWGLLGYGGVMLVDDEAHLMNVAVRSDARSAGLGTALVARLAAGAAERGASRLTLEVRPSNHAAIGLYEKTGFQAVGKRPGYYADSGEDAVVMWTGDLREPASRRRLAALVGAGDAALEAFRPPGGEEIDGACRWWPEPGQGPPPADDLVLAIETSCDETAAAVMRGGRELLSSVVASQVDFHHRFGGVVPEIASRKHTEAVVGVVEEALEQAGVGLADLAAVAVTRGPGLIGALVVGLAYAKGLAFSAGLPLVGVNHLEGHLFANVLADAEVAPPLVALVVSGGHTSLVHMPAWGEYRALGSTLDDAVGEAFDKVAKVMGLGYPGGPILSRLAEQGDPAAIAFPRAMIHTDDYDFSLSGLKTAVITHVRKERAAGREIDPSDLAASFQAAVVDVQVAKSVRAVAEHGVRTFCLAGGVAANPSLREALKGALEPLGVKVCVPPSTLCTDNAAMIAAAGHYRLWRGERLGMDAEAVADLRLD